MSKNKVEIKGIDTNKLKVLTNKEIIALFKELKKGNKEAKDKIVEGNLKLVLSIINKYNNGKNDMNDLFQIGCVGLLKAIDNFSLDYNVQFSTYAVPLILGEVKRLIRESSLIRISRSTRDLTYKILKYKEYYYSKYNKEPSNKEICLSLEITEYELANALESLVPTMSFSEPIYSDGGETIYLEDQIKDNKIQNVEDTISLKDALKRINERESQILYARYIYGKTQLELADDLGVSQAQISRIEKNAIKNVKRLMK